MSLTIAANVRTTRPLAIERGARVLFVALATICVLFYLTLFWRIVAEGEMFHRLGFDWTMFHAQAMTLRERGGQRMYDLSETDGYLRQLSTYYHGPAEFQTAQPVPYPPWFAAAVVPFTVPPPPIGFALWEAASVLAAVYLAYRVRQFLPELGLPGAAVAVLAAVPVATALYMGQVALLLAIPVAEMLVSFRGGRDFRAGVWLAVLLIKPQYALVFGLLILWKKRYQALAGLAVGTLGLLFVGALAAGIPAFVGLLSALREMGEFRGPFGGPAWMMNWRSIVLAVRPGIGDQAGFALVSSLSLLTMALSLLPWRGRWQPDSPSFAPRFCLLTLGALISSYHSHLHGAALLVVPMAAAWAEPKLRPLTRIAVCAAIYVPTLVLLWVAGVVNRLAVSADPDVPLWYVWPEALPAILFLVAFLLMSFDLLGAVRFVSGQAHRAAIQAPRSSRP